MMNHAAIPDILGRLSHDVMLLCTREGVVCEANPVAKRILGEHIINQPLETLFSDMVGSKGKAFLDQLLDLADNETSNTWELFFKVPDSNDITPINMRGGAVDRERILLVGACEPPQLTAIYHEVLAINSELTNLIRQLSKEQARLSARLERLLNNEEE